MKERKLRESSVCGVCEEREVKRKSGYEERVYGFGWEWLACGILVEGGGGGDNVV